MSKIRISAHCLEVEKGRYYRPIVPRDSRICKHCPQKVCDDEIHFLTECDFHSLERIALYRDMNALSKHFGNLSSKDKFLYMVNIGGKDIIKVAKFCHIGFDKRNEQN